ncbi:MAG: phage major capsid protein [Armatimonadota bacterium]|nr:phage major capsid protein [Armatimonadota bacterium]
MDTKEIAKVVGEGIREAVATVKAEAVRRPPGLELITRSGGQESVREPMGQSGSRFGAYVRAVALGARLARHPADVARMLGADDTVVRALNESTLSAGGVFVPEEFSREVITALQHAAVVRRAGARVLTMNTDTLRVGRFAGSATASWISEGADITASVPQTEEIVLTTKRLAALVPISNDLLRDAGVDVDLLIRDHLAGLMAAEEDVAFIRGDGTVNRPKGIRYWADPANVFAANSTVNVTNIVADLVKAVRLVSEGLRRNMVRPGWIMATRTFLGLTALRDQGQWVFATLAAPEPTLLGYPVFVTDQIPTNLGAGADESEVYFVDFGHCVIGQRQEIEIVASGEASYVEGGQMVSAFSRNETVIRAILRTDFALAYAKAASVITAVKWQ